MIPQRNNPGEINKIFSDFMLKERVRCTCPVFDFSRIGLFTTFTFSLKDPPEISIGIKFRQNTDVLGGYTMYPMKSKNIQI